MGCRRFLLDTNALVDFACPTYERPRHDDVAKVISQVFMGDHEAYVSMSSLKDMYYLLRKMGNSHEAAEREVARVMTIFSTFDLCERHARAALMSDEPDFEDGLIRAQAEELRVDAIVTDDRKAFRTCAIPHISAAECLRAFWPEAA